jgi:hypothetical protein
MLDPKHNPFFEQLKADIHAGIEHGSGRAARDRRRPRPGYHFLIQRGAFSRQFPRRSADERRILFGGWAILALWGLASTNPVNSTAYKIIATQ